ncbi:tetratricopeptide repeat protein [Mesorhizobium sp. CAU 1732]|uniref:tetratricopeptide repeat protein n=1 Tax=Mesorhizobium sp. CAU 1732 TaxID=3140358 RepID=UPI00325FF2BD
MRNVFAISLALLVVIPTVASAQSTGRSSTSITAPEEGSRLDALFTELKRAKNEPSAKRVSSRIWQEWSRSGSATTDLLMRWAQEAIDAEKYDVAMDFLDQVTLLAPDYAEGWNKRATLHFTMENYAKSMTDIDRTLRLEPRHFGALGGLAVILKNSGRKQAAMHAYERVLDVYPMMRDAQTELGKLADEMAGEGI